jgi:hypothetical protein
MVTRLNVLNVWRIARMPETLSDLIKKRDKLTQLLNSAKEMKFDESVILSYKKQLKEVNKEIKNGK